MTVQSGSVVDALEEPLRQDPPYVADERPMLEAWLDWHRVTLELKCAGLDSEKLRARFVPTSLMSLHGLVRHLAEVERNWFRRVLDGEETGGIYYDDDHPEGDFEIPDGAPFADDLTVWREECDRARAIASAHGLADTGVRRRTGDIVSLRWIYIHMIEEYARHNGHADLLRELADGTVGE